MDLALLNVRSFASEASRLEVLKIHRPKVMGLIETHARIEENCELVHNHQYCSSSQSATRMGGVGFVFRTDGTNWTKSVSKHRSSIEAKILSVKIPLPNKEVWDQGTIASPTNLLPNFNILISETYKEIIKNSS